MWLIDSHNQPDRRTPAGCEFATSSRRCSMIRTWCPAVSCAGLGPVVALAEQCGLSQLVAGQLTLPAKAGVNAHLKVPALVGAMVAGADSIADTDLLRHGGMDRLFGEIRAPSTLGTFLRAFTFGHVRQLDAVAGQLLAE